MLAEIARLQAEIKRLNIVYKSETNGRPKMKRNHEAVCGNCPYYDGDWCRWHAADLNVSGKELRPVPDYWCGEHPQFFLPKECHIGQIEKKGINK